MDLPKRYDSKEAEKKWQKYWEKEKIFAFNAKVKGKIFSIDTPPPTVSGKMHIGHAFSYTQQDFIARFKRMQGLSVFYPFGTDNNGVATERLIEQIKKIKSKDMDREKFRKICLDTLEKELRPEYIADWKRIGMSCDWDIFYDTIDNHSQKISQRSFIELYEKGLEYRKDAPIMWCPECQTGISQVECEDKEIESSFNDIVFTSQGKELIIGTTRPELLSACVAVFFHPDDKRYKDLAGKKAKVPLFNQLVPIMADERADPEKGTGLVMCCSFGDQTDMEWIKAYNLPIVEALGANGHMTAKAGKYEGMYVKKARKVVLEDLKEKGLLRKQEQIKRPVNVHERCGTSIEYIKSKQWFIKYLDKKKDMLAWGKQMHWFPKHMRVRYDHWIQGLQWDWLISRQRHFGVPFPVWYCKKCDEVILARIKDLPVDPLKDKAPVSKCPKCKGNEFIPEKDVLDTWATSSLTPQLAIELMPKSLQKKLYPMSLRPQAHDIITFWLFNTVVKSQLHNSKNPWEDIIISGHALDPHGKKMSKSKGNVVEPQEMIEKYSSDALRFWSAGSKLGDDLPFQEKDLVTGEKFITKLWNASKFCFMHLEDYKDKKVKLEKVDEWFLSSLSKIIESSTQSFEKYEYSKTKLDVETFFWRIFCDYYLEIVKDRLYNPDQRGKNERISAQYGLYHGLLAILKLIAPIMPHISEEIYQMYYAAKEKKKSIHISSWPVSLFSDENAEKLGKLVMYAVGNARKAKTDKNLSLKTEIKHMVLKSKIKQEEFEKVEGDIRSAGVIETLEYQELDAKSKDEFDHEIRLE